MRKKGLLMFVTVVFLIRSCWCPVTVSAEAATISVQGSHSTVPLSAIAKLFANPITTIAAVVLVILIVLIVLIVISSSRKKKNVLSVESPLDPNQLSMSRNWSNPILAGVSGHFAGNNMIISGVMIIGRDSGQCQVVFPASTTDISRRHCSISFDLATQSFVLEDLNSSNGTYLSNGQCLIPGQPHYLKNVERFYLGVPSNMFEVRI
ncbi:MAG TPA: FHA domain-containing protein [Desulfosporosinus sp.]|nr:FHA domain-containing protein [Desulfosporosinus sp.]